MYVVDVHTGQSRRVDIAECALGDLSGEADRRGETWRQRAEKQTDEVRVGERQTRRQIAERQTKDTVVEVRVGETVTRRERDKQRDSNKERERQGERESARGRWLTCMRAAFARGTWAALSLL